LLAGLVIFMIRAWKGGEWPFTAGREVHSSG